MFIIPTCCERVRTFEWVDRENILKSENHSKQKKNIFRLIWNQCRNKAAIYQFQWCWMHKNKSHRFRFSFHIICSYLSIYLWWYICTYLKHLVNSSIFHSFMCVFLCISNLAYEILINLKAYLLILLYYWNWME